MVDEVNNEATAEEIRELNESLRRRSAEAIREAGGRILQASTPPALLSREEAEASFRTDSSQTEPEAEPPIREPDTFDLDDDEDEDLDGGDEDLDDDDEDDVIEVNDSYLAIEGARVKLNADGTIQIIEPKTSVQKRNIKATKLREEKLKQKVEKDKQKEELKIQAYMKKQGFSVGKRVMIKENLKDINLKLGSEGKIIEVIKNGKNYNCRVRFDKIYSLSEYTLPYYDTFNIGYLKVIPNQRIKRTTDKVMKLFEPRIPISNVLPYKEQIKEINKIKEISKIELIDDYILITTKQITKTYKKEKYNIGSYIFRIDLKKKIRGDDRLEFKRVEGEVIIKVKSEYSGKTKNYYHYHPYDYRNNDIPREDKFKGICFGYHRTNIINTLQNKDYLSTIKLCIGMLISDSEGGTVRWKKYLESLN